METLFSRESCRVLWQVLFCMEKIRDFFSEKKDSLAVKGIDWGYFEDEDGELDNHGFIGFELKPAKKRTSPLWIGFLFTKEGIKGECLFWIEDQRQDPQIWERLKKEFPEGKIVERSGFRAIGLIEPSQKIMNSDAELEEGAKNLAARIATILCPQA